MARINVEDSIWFDLRFERLSGLLGSKKAAIGELVYLWRVAQEYWRLKEPIPKELFEQTFSQFLLECGLVEQVENGFYAKGTQKAFSWIAARRSAGRKGGRAKQNQANASKPKQTQASYSYSSSYSFSSSKKKKEKEVKEKKEEERVSGEASSPSTCSSFSEDTERKPSVSYGSCLEIDPILRDSLKKKYPGVDLDYEVGKMEAWIAANPNKHKKNWHRFVVNWLARVRPDPVAVNYSMPRKGMFDEPTA